jgi:hypothetical protein
MYRIKELTEYGTSRTFYGDFETEKQALLWLRLWAGGMLCNGARIYMLNKYTAELKKGDEVFHYKVTNE